MIIAYPDRAKETRARLRAKRLAGYPAVWIGFALAASMRQ
jgi:hypothetical protein